MNIETVNLTNQLKFYTKYTKEKKDWVKKIEIEIKQR